MLCSYYRLEVQRRQSVNQFILGPHFTIIAFNTKVADNLKHKKRKPEAKG
jgi:hypothetical protein